MKIYFCKERQKPKNDKVAAFIHGFTFQSVIHSQPLWKQKILLTYPQNISSNQTLHHSAYLHHSPHFSSPCKHFITSHYQGWVQHSKVF